MGSFVNVLLLCLIMTRLISSLTLDTFCFLILYLSVVSSFYRLSFVVQREMVIMLVHVSCHSFISTASQLIPCLLHNSLVSFVT